MFPTINETRFNGITTSNSLIYNGFSHGPSTGHRKLSEEEQHLYNHHIIENFVESVREMNDVVLIPSKLKDLDPTTSTGMSNNYVALNDDLYSYYQMINVVKNDLFEPHNDFEAKKHFLMPKRKISRQHRREQDQHNHQQHNGNGHTRNLSSSSLSSLATNGVNGQSTPGPVNNGYQHQDSTSDSLETLSSSSDTGTVAPTATASPLLPLSSEQLIGQSAKQLTVQFIHHLHSLYTILEHFTNAADFITERYMLEVETV